MRDDLLRTSSTRQGSNWNRRCREQSSMRARDSKEPSIHDNISMHYTIIGYHLHSGVLAHSTRALLCSRQESCHLSLSHLFVDGTSEIEYN